MGGEVFGMIASSVLSKVVGGMFTKKPKAPSVDTTAANSEIKTASSNSMKARTALLETAGGQAGAELAPGQVANSRDTILGN